MKRSIKSRKYIKPEITEQKIKLNFFRSGRFMDSMNAIFMPPVFPQSTCSDCVSCSSCGGCDLCGGE